MRDDEHTSENVIAVSFAEQANAYEALARLKELEAKGAVALRDAAVALEEEDGKEDRRADGEAPRAREPSRHEIVSARKQQTQEENDV